MKGKIIILLIALIVATVGSVSAEYQPSIENKAFEKYSIEQIISWSYESAILVAIYESSEHHNQLVEEQNRLLKEQNKIQWIMTCYRPMFSGSAGNNSGWKIECINAGYPVD